MIFQLAADYYRKPALYNDLLQHVTIPGPVRAGAILGKQVDFQLTYEHNARAMAAENPDIRYVNLPDEINLSNPKMDAWYRQHASIVLPGLGSPGAARSVAIPAARVAWGITILKNAPNPAAAVKFLKMLLGREGAALLEANGPSPLSPAVVSSERLPASPRAATAACSGEGSFAVTHSRERCSTARSDKGSMVDNLSMSESHGTPRQRELSSEEFFRT